MKAIILTLLTTLNIYSAKNMIKIGFLEYPPYFTENKDGIIQKEIESLFENYQVEWVYSPLVRVSSLLSTRYIDLNTSIVKTEDRSKIFDFSESHYYKIAPHICLLSNKKEKLKKNVFKSLNDRRLIISKGNHFINDIRKHSSNTKIISFTYSNNYVDRAYQMLVRERADFVFFPTLDSNEYVKQNKLFCRVAGPHLPLSFSFKKGSPMKKEVDKVISVTNKKFKYLFTK